MPITIGSNIGSLRLLRRLDSSTNELGKTYERLSSGLRINRASDDPAGLAVSSELNSRARILNRARQNLNDATSVLSIADGSLDSLANLVTRMTELAEQAANGSMTNAQRLSLSAEYEQLDREVQRLSTTTTFNGLSLLNGGKSTSSLRTVTTDAIGVGSTALSADGRFQAYVSGNEDVKLVDTQNNTTRTVEDPGGLFNTTAVKVLVNGDAVIQSENASGVDLYYYDYANNRTRRLTRSRSSSDGANFEVSADGSMVAFYASTLYTDNQSADVATTSGPGKIYVIDTITRIVRKVNSTGAAVNTGTIAISADGNYVAAGISATETVVSTTRGSSLNITSVNPGGAVSLGGVTNSGVAYYSRSGSAYSLNFSTQSIALLKAGSNLTNLKMSTDGASLYFLSTNNWTGENSGGNRQAFKLDTGSTEVTQLTSFTSQISVTTGAISADGGTYVFSSNGNDLNSLDLSPDDNQFDFEVGSGNSGGIVARLSSTLRSLRGLGGLNVASRMMASAALDRGRENIKALASLRGTIGAAQSRIDTAASLTSSQYTSVLESSSRITDADLADETSKLVRQSILQQSASGLLAQVNQQPALVLRLLG